MNKKRHKILSITSCIVLILSITIYIILNWLNLTTKTEANWYELLLSLALNISSYYLIWELGVTHYIKVEKTKNDNK